MNDLRAGAIEFLTKAELRLRVAELLAAEELYVRRIAKLERRLADERERCAAVCDRLREQAWNEAIKTRDIIDLSHVDVIRDCAIAIRALGDTTDG